MKKGKNGFELTGEDYLLHFVYRKWRSIQYLKTVFGVETPSEKKIFTDFLIKMEKEGKIVSQIKNEKKKLRSTYALAYEYFDQENYEEAIRYFKKILQYSTIVLTNLADSYENLGNKEMAIKYRKMRLIEYPNDFHDLMNLGSTYISFNDFEKAKEVFLNCLEKFMDRAMFEHVANRILFQLAITYYLLEDYESALKWINVIIKSAPNNSIAIKLYEDIKTAKKSSIKKNKELLFDYFDQEDRRVDSTQLLYQFEERLVKFIYHKLKEKFGKDWFNHGVPLKIRKMVLNFKRYEKRSYKIQEYLGFTDYIDIIQENWEKIFSKSFKNKKKRDILKSLNEIRIIRNRLYHYKEKYFEEDQKRLNNCIFELYNDLPTLSELLGEK